MEGVISVLLRTVKIKKGKWEMIFILIFNRSIDKADR